MAFHPIKPETRKRFAERLRAEQAERQVSLVRRLRIAYSEALQKHGKDYADEVWGSQLAERGVSL